MAAHKSRAFELPAGDIAVAALHGNNRGCHVPTNPGSGSWHADFGNHCFVRYWSGNSGRICAGEASKGVPFILRPFVEGSVDIFGVSVDFQRIIVVLGGAILFGLLWLFVNKSKLGLALKGMAQDERAALTLGIDSDRMAVVAMGLGSALAGAAGLILLPLGNIVVEAGYNVLIMAVAVCIVGGLGSWTGAIMAAFLIGFAQILTVAYFGAHYKIVVALCAIILALILRPSGLFGRQKELEERV